MIFYAEQVGSDVEKKMRWLAILALIFCCSLPACSRSERNPKTTPLISEEAFSVCAEAASKRQTYEESMSGFGEAALNPGHTPLMKAAFEGDIQATINELVVRRGSINRQDKFGYTALLYSVLGNHLNVFKVLLANGARIDLKTKVSESPLAITAATWGRTEMLEELFEQKKLDPNLTDTYQSTLLHHAASRCHTTTVALLIEKEADVDSRDNEGRTPLMDATQGGALEVVEILLKNKANPNLKTKLGNTALHFAMTDFNFWTERLNRPGVRLKLTQLLQDYGADPEIRNEEGLRPVDLVQKNLKPESQEEIFKVLKR